MAAQRMRAPRVNSTTRPRPRAPLREVVTPSEPEQNVERISMLPDDRYLLTPAEAARRLSISRALCYRLISSGEIPSILIGAKLRRIPDHALRAYIEQQMLAAGA